MVNLLWIWILLEQFFSYGLLQLYFTFSWNWNLRSITLYVRQNITEYCCYQLLIIIVVAVIIIINKVVQPSKSVKYNKLVVTLLYCYFAHLVDNHLTFPGLIRIYFHEVKYWHAISRNDGIISFINLPYPWGVRGFAGNSFSWSDLFSLFFLREFFLAETAEVFSTNSILFDQAGMHWEKFIGSKKIYPLKSDADSILSIEWHLCKGLEDDTKDDCLSAISFTIKWNVQGSGLYYKIQNNHDKKQLNRWKFEWLYQWNKCKTGGEMNSTNRAPF